MIDLRRGRERTVLVLVAVVCVTWLTVRYMYQPKSMPVLQPLQNIKVQRMNAPQSTIRPGGLSNLHPSVNVVKSYPSGELPYNDCVPLPESPRAGVKICVYPSQNDIYVSKDLKEGRLFERHLIRQMADVLQSDPTLQFIDMGANIGIYTMFAAACGKTVLSVEMLPANIHQIQHSLAESGLSNQVTLVNNALFSDHRSLTANFISGNVGATHLNVSKTDFAKYGMREDNSHTVTVKTICIDDLIPLLKSKKVFIKIDIERAEAKALSCAHKFFDEVDVRVIQMEWMAKSKDEIISINQFMLEHGFKASKSGMKYIPENTNVATTGSNNVFFIKA
ncbi:uncharacterized protein LOC101855988 [Aplysia californica]|uniref:Uncharacterized protein LOC101855988 n=1 Tax=Aplysia californica TaxID=6500 RepID=A0ABM0K8A9_APLCA|nr:uncharacterized protein LOC101855988 [Aplysia californica]XP_005111166.1 uncharacterized protein LOC101855988 [Aplysia californica]XP_005111167.1 uncharacterized protein LOC101855988 [Aplysia californica]XP_005111168.1 uncharacterized protein LOC101855988 [Aplysia californica]